MPLEYMGSVKQETLNGVKWGMIQKFTMQPVQFLFGILLARLITPAEMGIVGLTAIFFAVAAQLKDAGFGAALIQKQDRTEEDCSTVFWYNVGVSALLALALFMAAPWFADFYHEPALTDVSRVSAIMLLLNSTAGVHWALYSARRDFKTPAIVGMVSTLVAMPVTIWAAYVGWSYWALVLQGVVSGALSLIIIWIVSPWKPRFIFSLASFRRFFSYGSKLLASGMIWTVYSESRTFLIGKFYSTAQLAFYTRAHHLCYMPVHYATSMIGGVIFPVLSAIQDDEERLLGVYSKYIRLIGLLTIWPMLLLVTNADNVIYCLYGENWLPAAFYAKIICLGALLDPLAYVAVQMFLVKGRTDLSLRREIWLRSFALVTMIIGACHSVAGVCYALVAACVFNAFISSYYVSKCSGISMKRQAVDLWRYLLPAAMAVIPCYVINSIVPNAYLALLCSSVFSAALFMGMMYIKRDPMAVEVYGTFMNSKIGKFIFRKSQSC